MGSRNFANTAKRDGLHPAQMLLVASQKIEYPKVPPGTHIIEYLNKYFNLPVSLSVRVSEI